MLGAPPIDDYESSIVVKSATTAHRTDAARSEGSQSEGRGDESTSRWLSRPSEADFAEIGSEFRDLPANDNIVAGSSRLT